MLGMIFSKPHVRQLDIQCCVEMVDTYAGSHATPPTHLAVKLALACHPTRQQSFRVLLCRWEIEADEARPHGIRYELTLHDAGNRRILGFDNAHAVKRPGGRFVEQPRAYDHLHRGPRDAGVPYSYSSAGKLIGDFWQAVFKVLEELGESP